MVTLPRVLVAAPASGHGKTMLSVGLMGALHRRGLTVAPAKVGPDYIDPGYHALATKRPSRNLDPVLCSPELVPQLLLRGATVPAPADVAVIEGVMGLFDGRVGRHGEGSAAHVASLTDTPVVLCADASRTSRTIAATVAGLAGFDSRVRVAGVIFNKVSSPRQRSEICDAMSHVDVPVLGFLPKDESVEAPSRHLGLVPAAERPDAAEHLSSLFDLIEEHVDLDALLDVARTAPPLPHKAWDPTDVVRAPSASHPVVAVAGGRAFTFRYAETVELLEAGGCIVEEFDPTSSPHLPGGTAGLYLGGGFPEVHATELASNQSLLDDVRLAVADGVPTVAECAGMLYLGESLDGVPMAGALPLRAAMGKRLQMGYRDAVALVDSPLAGAGTRVVGHEHHRTAAQIEAPTGWDLVGLHRDGVATSSVHASYLHVHWAGHPALAQRFINACHERNT